MLRHLSIRDFVIVAALDLEFDSGFTVFSGETGAGKSILIDALALALGARADASVVRTGEARADITAEFETHAQARAVARRAGAGLGRRCRGRRPARQHRHAAARGRRERPLARLHQRHGGDARAIARSRRNAGRHSRPACAPVADAPGRPARTVRYPRRTDRQGRRRGPRLAQLARQGAGHRTRQDARPRAATRARTPRMAVGRTRQARPAAGRMGRGQRRTQPPVAFGQPDRRRAGCARRAVRVGRGDDHASRLDRLQAARPRGDRSGAERRPRRT